MPEKQKPNALLTESRTKAIGYGLGTCKAFASKPTRLLFRHDKAFGILESIEEIAHSHALLP